MSSDLGGHNSQPEPLPALLGRLQTLRSRRQKPAAAPHPARTLRACTVAGGAARVENKITAKNQAIVMLREIKLNEASEPLFGCACTLESRLAVLC